MFAVREFRFVFAAHVMSILGTVFAQVSLAVLVFAQSGSALLTSLVFALTVLPYALSGLLLSGIADRHPARQVLVTCDLVSAACVAAMTLPITPLPVLFVLLSAQSMVTPLFVGTRGASLTEFLDGDEFILGRSLIRIVSMSAQIAGFGLGGLVLVWLSPRAALCVTVGTFLCSATLLRTGTAVRPARRTGRGALLRQSLAASGQLLSDPRIRSLMLMWWMPPAFFAVAEGVAAPFADAAGARSAGLGLFLAAMPAGTAISESLAGILLGPAGRERIALPLAGVCLLPLAAFALHPALPVAVALLVVTGLCSAYALGMDKWFVDAVPEDLRGRAMSLVGAGLMTFQGAGMAIGGAVAEAVPPFAVIGGGGMLGAASLAAVVRAVHRSSGHVGLPATPQPRAGTPA